MRGYEELQKKKELEKKINKQPTTLAELREMIRLKKEAENARTK